MYSPKTRQLSAALGNIGSATLGETPETFAASLVQHLCLFTADNIFATSATHIDILNPGGSREHASTRWRWKNAPSRGALNHTLWAPHARHMPNLFKCSVARKNALLDALEQDLVCRLPLYFLRWTLDTHICKR